MGRPVVILALAFVALAPAARADPRWWWSDVRLTSTPTDSITPHLITPTYASGGGGFNNLFLTWAEVDPADGDLDVWVTASFDGGCTFCVPTRITDTSVDETNPRIAVLALPTGFWSIAVAFEQPATGQVIVAWDSTHVNFRVPPDQLCAEVSALGPQLVAGDQYVRFGGVDAAGSWPDISAAGTPLFGHFHLAWQESTLAGPRIRYAHDLSGAGGLGWTMDPVKTLASLGPIDVALERPRLAADLGTDADPISGLDTMDRSAANVIFVRHREAGPAVLAEVDGLRSVDSGATFSPTGARADAPAAALSDSFGALPSLDTRPALDASFSPFTTTEPAWIAAAWSWDSPSGVALWGDERYLPDPAAPAPDWQVPGDQAFGSSTTTGDGAPSIALSRRFGSPLAEWVAWQASWFGASEIVSRAGMLTTVAAPMLDPWSYPIAPVRPQDTGVSTDVQLSHCVVDDATFACVPTRALGDARQVALDANEMTTFAVWSDSRDGNREIYFKRTDESVASVTPRLAADCGIAGDAVIDVTFDLVASCPTLFANERMLRYLVYYRRDVAAPYENAATPLVVLAAGEPGPSVTRRLTGLLPGTTYHVLVVPEDEARNVSPADFDPRVAPALAPFAERSIDTPAPCVAIEPCLWRVDVVSLLPHVPVRAAVYLVPPSVDDIHLQGPSYDCPIATGDLEPDANALDNGVALSLYQVNRPVDTLRLEKSARTIKFTF